MLDFYLIDFDDEIPKYPELMELPFVGSLDYEVFLRLQKKGFIEDKYDYYEDFRWKFETIKTYFKRLENNLDTDVFSLKEILKETLNKEKDLVAFAD